MEDVRYITVGKIVNTHGNKGFLRVVPLTDFPDRFLKMEKILLLHNDDRKVLHIEQSSSHRKFIIIKFREIPDMTEAEKLKGAYLQIPKSELKQLPENTFYIFEILGCEVFTLQGEFLGIVEDVIQTGANDVYVVENKHRQKPLLIPALKSVVRRVDIEEGRIDVVLPAGLEV